jgi:hypothetical protein
MLKNPEAGDNRHTGRGKVPHFGGVSSKVLFSWIPDIRRRRIPE